MAESRLGASVAWCFFAKLGNILKPCKGALCSYLAGGAPACRMGWMFYVGLRLSNDPEWQQLIQKGSCLQRIIRSSQLRVLQENYGSSSQCQELSASLPVWIAGEKICIQYTLKIFLPQSDPEPRDSPVAFLCWWTFSFFRRGLFSWPQTSFLNSLLGFHFHSIDECQWMWGYCFQSCTRPSPLPNFLTPHFILKRNLIPFPDLKRSVPVLCRWRHQVQKPSAFLPMSQAQQHRYPLRNCCSDALSSIKHNTNAKLVLD